MIRHIKENTYEEHMNFMPLTMIDPIHKKNKPITNNVVWE